MGFVRFLRLGWGLYSEGVHLTFVFPLFFSQIGPFFCSSFLFLFSSLSFIFCFHSPLGPKQSRQPKYVLGLVACPSNPAYSKNARQPFETCRLGIEVRC